VKESELRQFIADNPPAAEFRPYCQHVPESDSLTLYVKGDADYSGAAQVRPLAVTVYRSLATGEVVGFRIDGISQLLTPVEAPR
jgi:hypothetical protein